ncbi:MAG: hypothetical protein ACRDKA_06035 [Actinomycetota bacterium]
MADLGERFQGLDRLSAPDLRSEIRGRTPGSPPTGPPWRRLGGAVAALMVAAAGLALAGRAFLGGREEGPSPRGPSLASSSERAATVGIAALTEAGLRDGIGLVPVESVPGDEDPGFRTVAPYDYGGVRPQGEGWVAAFCSSPPEDSDCDETTADSFVKIVPEGEDLVVVEASGAFTEAQRDHLLGYRESAEPPPAQWIYRPVRLIGDSDRGDQMVAGLSYWTGSIPSHMGALCHTEVLDQQGQVVYAFRDVPALPPETEGGRDSNYVAEIPEDLGGSDARVVCGEWLPIQSFPEGPRHVLASGTVESGEHAGETWRLVVWRGENEDDPDLLELWRLNAEGADVYCWGFDGRPWTSVRYGQRVPQGGCTVLAPDLEPEPIGARSSGPVLGEGSTVVVGEVSTEVASLELRLNGGEVIEADLLDPPPELGIPVRFFVEFLPPGGKGQMAALNEDGKVLATERL